MNTATEKEEYESFANENDENSKSLPNERKSLITVNGNAFKNYNIKLNLLYISLTRFSKRSSRGKIYFAGTFR